MRNKITKKNIVLVAMFMLLCLNYATNFLGICEKFAFLYFDRGSEISLIRKLDNAQQHGIFYNAGFPGNSFDTTSGNSENYIEQVISQYDLFLNNEHITSEYTYVYKSQPNLQGTIYVLIQAVSPFNNATNLKIFRLMNAALTALIFVVFISWVWRNFNITTAIITFLLLGASSWIIMFSHNLWWSFWSFYIPFVTALLLYEKRHVNPKKYSSRKIFLIFTLAMFAKGLFSGFEFITTIIISALCPTIYYLILEKENIKTICKSVIRDGFAAVCGTLLTMLLLIFQLRILEGNFKDAVGHIIYSYVNRTSFEYEGVPIGLTDILNTYLTHGSPYPFIPSFLILFSIIVCMAVIIIYLNKNRQNIALIITTLISIAAPLSWLIIFKQHAALHEALDYIVWYMPLLLYGFIIIGQAISSIIEKFIYKPPLIKA